MELKIHTIQMRNFHFFDMNEMNDEDKERILKRKDSIDIGTRKVKDESLELMIIPKMKIKFTFDERYYYLGDLSGQVSLYNMTEKEFNDQDIQTEFIKKIMQAFTTKFDMFVGICSQEVYSGTRMPDRNKIEIVKHKN